MIREIDQIMIELETEILEKKLGRQTGRLLAKQARKTHKRGK